MEISEEIRLLGHDLFSMGFDIPREAISRLVEAGWTYRPENRDLLTPEGRRKVLRDQAERNRIININLVDKNQGLGHIQQTMRRDTL